MDKTNDQPDWDRIAERFDILTPQLAPVGEALIEALQPGPGDRIMDLASGTGEPALTLARRRPDVRITGIDAAAGMVRTAQGKAAAEGLNHIEFREMAAEHLEFPDQDFDRALCRFGLMLFEDPLQGCREIHRVLKPGGRLAASVWHTPETMTAMYWAVEVFRGHVADEQLPPIALATSLGGPGTLEALLAEAGFSGISVTAFDFAHRYRSFEDWWEATLASGILTQQFEALPAGDHHWVREAFAGIAQEYCSGQGLVIPHRCLIATATAARA